MFVDMVMCCLSKLEPPTKKYNICIEETNVRAARKSQRYDEDDKFSFIKNHSSIQNYTVVNI